jgi:hypothetical protein
MSSSDRPREKGPPKRALFICVELAANYVYLAKQTKDPAQLKLYLDFAEDLLFEIRHHPDLPR